MTFIENCSRYLNVYHITHKWEVLDEFQSFLAEKGIHGGKTVPHQPQKKDNAERMNTTDLTCGSIQQFLE